ncbi:MAG: VWA domain-containing protein [Clostridia bacterium]|nr:VWA domain-containing protein [Clostridia bacterium]
MEKQKKKISKITIFLIILMIIVIIVMAAVVKFWVIDNIFKKNLKESQGAKIIDTTVLPKEMIDENDDYDGDGILNKDELENNTSVYSKDTDADGMSDSLELKIGTDPTKWDTDGDGIGDLNEVLNSLNPLLQKTDGQTLDNEVKFTKEIEVEDAKLIISGNANISDVEFGKSIITNADKKYGVYGNIYQIYLNTEFDSAKIEFSYDMDELKKLGYQIDDISVYEYKPKDGSYEKVESYLNEENNTIGAELEHFSYYCIADSRYINEEYVTNIHFLIDNSGSMYTPEQAAMKDKQERNEEEYSEMNGNDPEYKRLTMVSSLVNKLGTEKFNFAISKFTKTCTKLVKTTNDIEELNEALDKIRNDKENFNGTYIFNALYSTINTISTTSKTSRKAIIMVTDGDTTETTGILGTKRYDEDDIIKKANDNNVVLYIIGLGNEPNSQSLAKMANGTGGMYFYATDSNALEELYMKLTETIGNEPIDLNKDGELESYLVADSGFQFGVDNFSFSNYGVKESKGGQCYGLSVFVRDYYLNKLNLQGDAYETDKFNFVKGADPKEYDLTGISYIANREGKLYGFKLESMDMMEQYSGRLLALNFEDGKMVFKEDVRDMLLSNGFEIYTKSYTANEENVKKIENFGYKAGDKVEFEDIYINDESEKFEKAYSSEVEFYRCIYNLFQLQYLKAAADPYNIEDGEGFAKLKESLSSGIPCVVIKNRAHAINAVNLYQDVENPNQFTLITYDNAYLDDDSKIEYSIVRQKVAEAYDELGALEKIKFDNLKNFITLDYIYKCYDSDGNDIKLEVDLVNANI